MSLAATITRKETTRDFIFQCARDVAVMAPRCDEAQAKSWELRDLAFILDKEINQLRRQATNGEINA